VKQFSFINLITFFAGICSSFFGANYLHQQFVKETQFEFERAANDRVMAIKRNIESSMLVSRSAAGFFYTSEVIKQNQFSNFATLILDEIPYIKAIEWIPRVNDEKRHEFEANAATLFPNYQITERNSNSELVRAKSRDVYYPVYYLEPLNGNEKAVGYDLASNPIRKHALDIAKNNNVMSSTGGINLVQDKSNSQGFLIYTPVYKHTNLQLLNLEVEKNIRGLIVLVFDIPSLIKSSLSYLHPVGLHFTIRDITEPNSSETLHFHKSRTQSASNTNKTPHDNIDDSSMVFTESINVANRQWSIQLFPAANYYHTKFRFVDYTVLIIGIAISCLLHFYMQLLHNQKLSLKSDKRLLEDLVKQRTKDLDYRNEELEAYSYSIAHDLRAPLRSIMGFSQILEEDASRKLNETEKSHLNRIIRSTHFMSTLIDDILNLSRVVNVNLATKEVNLSEIAEDTINRLNLYSLNKQTIHWDIQENLFEKADPNMLNVLLENLLGNAIKFSSMSKSPKIEFGMTKIKGKSYYFVRDNGVGFDNEFAEKAFGLFRRLHTAEQFEGTGVGLAIAKRVVEKHGGIIWGEGKVNEGATFYFSLSS